MFTGIITATAHVESSKGVDNSLELKIETPKGWKLKPGDSVAVNGVCVTVNRVAQSSWATVLVPETLKLTSFGKVIPEQLNLERPLAADGRFDGHIVQGHVDTVGKIIKIDKQLKLYTITFPKRFAKLLIQKGSIAIDGVSLTVTRVTATSFSLALIPYTLKHTVLGSKQVGDMVNLEFDILAKYLQRSKRTP